MMKIQGQALTITAVPEKAVYTITQENGSTWEMSGRAYVELSDRTKLYLDEAEAVQATERKTGTWHGIGADYTLPGGLVLHTLVYVENTRDDVYFVNRLEGDRLGQIRFVSFPSAVEFDTPEHMGYTVLPRMQGTIIPAGHPIELRYGVDEGQDTRMETGTIYERNAYIPLFGQVRYRQPDTKIGRGTGYMLVYDTPYDANYALQGENIQPLFKTSLGHMSYPRKLLYRFFADCDYNDFAHSYREYLEERGQIVTLAEKCAKNPAVERLLGQPIIHEGIATHISEQSHFYDPENPEANDHYVSFAKRAEQLKTLKERGLDGGYIHLDGWGLHGYDNLHPDVMPPHEGAGGAEGMKQLSETARELGYIFGIHDQYRDYYYDAPSFDFANAVSAAAGNHPYSSYWYGGPHTVLCATLAPDYVRRNYDEFERLGIVIEGSYLDVFSVVPNDECFNPEHPMTREQCARARMECFEVLTAKGIIPSSEEVLGCMIPSLVLCHHAPYYTANWRSREAASVGIHFPLLNLVYHDCIVIPWLGHGRKQRGGWGIPGADAPYMHGILNGNPVYCPITAETGLIEEVREACALAGKLAKQRMIRHEFLDDTFRRQRTVWEDGTVIEVDMDSCEYTVTNA